MYDEMNTCRIRFAISSDLLSIENRMSDMPLNLENELKNFEMMMLKNVGNQF